MNFGEFCRKEMNGMGKSIHWLTIQVGASASVISKWRKGTNPKTEYFLKVCRVISQAKGIPLLEVIIQAAASMGIELDERD